jgi:hypothetical protein
MKYIFIIIFCGTLIGCKSSNDGIYTNYISLVPDTIVCEVVNSLIDSINRSYFEMDKRVLDKVSNKILGKEDSIWLNNLDTLLTAKDVEFLFVQDSNAKYFDLNKCIPAQSLISTDSLSKLEQNNFWEKFHRIYGRGGFISISLPLFSIKGDIFIVQYSHTFGPLGGSGGTYVYKKYGSKWKQILIIDHWIS